MTQTVPDKLDATALKPGISGESTNDRSRPIVPWRTGLALLLAIGAQSLLEPPVGSVPLALAGYGLALVCLIWAWRLHEFGLPDMPTVVHQAVPQTYRRAPLMAALLLTMVAFGLLSGNQFTWLNVTVWLAAVALFVGSVWIDPPKLRVVLSRLAGVARRERWSLSISRWTALLVVVSGLIVFFRFYQLDAVPGEPISDHAEKLLDVYDVTQGRTPIFFERNSGREFIQFYWTAAIAAVLGTGLSFISLKIGTAIIGVLTLPYIYLLGKEIGGRRVALLALMLAGMAYWLNTISRIGLRFTLYPAFTAPVLYHLIRGLRRQTRNDFVLAGLFMGLGLHGYTAFRIVPMVAAAGIGVFVAHRSAAGQRRQTLQMFLVLIVAAFLVSLPLVRYATENPDTFAKRTLTRLTESEQSLSAPVGQVFIANTLNALLLFNYDDGRVWVHSVRHRPALDLVSAVLFVFGVVGLVARYWRKRHWLDLFLLLAVPLLLLPSILALAFPAENPALNRTGGAAVVVFIIAALALDGIYTAVQAAGKNRRQRSLAAEIVGVLLLVAVFQNYTLVFEGYITEYRWRAWNATDLGRVVRAFVATGHNPGNAFIVPYAHWVDTRLVAIEAGYLARDFAVWPADLAKTQAVAGSKLFLVKDDDTETLTALRHLYPIGQMTHYTDTAAGKNFWVYTTFDMPATESGP